MTSLWMSDPSTPGFLAPLQGAITADVAVVGAGITGLLTARALQRDGLRVAVIEAHEVGDGSTGHSTGNLYAPVAAGMTELRRRWGDEVLQQVCALRAAAVDAIEQQVQAGAIDCAFVRCPLVYAVSGDDAQTRKRFDDELDAYRAAGLAPEPVATDSLPLPTRRAFRIEGQAQFNPWRFIRALARQVAEQGGLIHERSPVTAIDADTGTVVTAAGKVNAGHIVAATHTPPGLHLVHAQMEVFREYGLAVPLAQALDDGIFWWRDRGRSLRRHRHDGRDWLVLVGEQHRTGENPTDADPWQRLRGDAGASKDGGYGDGAGDDGDNRDSFRWAAQQYRPADRLPFIGTGGDDRLWLATGFSADGLVWGAVAADLIRRGILGASLPEAGLFNPRRFTPLKSATGWAREGATVAKHLVGTRLRKPALDPDSVAPGEGRLVSAGGERYAVYRDAEGALTVLSPVCPHMKCIVQWNGQENTWDCPCHGSRFTCQGAVIEGPAQSGLTAATDLAPDPDDSDAARQ